jgi:hypothetical protein
MMTTVGKPLECEIALLVEQIIRAGQMTQTQHFQLASAMLSNQQMNETDRRQINRAFDYLQTGRVKLIHQ